MAKKKKSKLWTEFNKSIRNTHKRKSNKLIYAVAGGLVIVLLIFILVSTGGDGAPVNKEKLIIDTTDYLKKNTSITDIVAVPVENKAIVNYDTSLVDDSQKDISDFRLMARYAAIMLSNKIKDEEVQILFREDNNKEKPYLAVAKNGEILREQVVNQ